jgi:dipeptidase E
MPGTPFFTWPKPIVKEFFDRKIKEAVFIPFAAVTFSFDEYEAKVNEAFLPIGVTVKSIHREKDMVLTIENAQAILVGGGNTFALLSRVYENRLLEAIRSKVLNGTPYVGWSAGSNLACPTIMTTNDMPVIQPPSFDALDLVPFQINPHYHELKFEGQGGETRKERLEEFLMMNQTKTVIGLPEGMGILVKDGSYKLVGNGIAKVYKFGEEVREIESGKFKVSGLRFKI